jgi:hypothetical protein
VTCRAAGTLAALIAALAVAACASSLPFLRRGCPVELAQAGEFTDASVLRARARVTVDERDIPLEVVVQREAGAVIVLGLAPHGPRLFAATQRGGELDVEAASIALRYLALYVVDALHRAYWIGQRPVTDLPSEQSFAWGAEWVRDAEDDRPRREFRDREGGEVAVEIEYRVGAEAGSPAAFEIRNRRCGYRAVFVPLR